MNSDAKKWIKSEVVIIHKFQDRFGDQIIQQTRDSVVHDGPTLKQHWVNVSCLLGWGKTFCETRWPWPPLLSPSKPIQGSMGEGVLHNLVFTEFPFKRFLVTSLRFTEYPWICWEIHLLVFNVENTGLSRVHSKFIQVCCQVLNSQCIWHWPSGLLPVNTIH